MQNVLVYGVSQRLTYLNPMFKCGLHTRFNHIMQLTIKGGKQSNKINKACMGKGVDINFESSVCSTSEVSVLCAYHICLLFHVHTSP